MRVRGFPVLFLVLVLFLSCRSWAADLDRLAKESGIPRTAIDKAAMFGANPKRLIGLDDEGEEKPAPGFTIEVPYRKSRVVVGQLSKALGKAYVVFVSDQSFGYKNQPDLVAVIKSSDQFDAMRTMGTAGWNHDITPAMAIGRLKEWDKLYGLVIVGAGMDWVEATFRRKPSPMLPFAREVFEFCPDVVEQGTVTVEGLAKEMEQANSVFLWWD